MNNQAIDLFLVAATGLLGSPGPAIAALLAVGKAHGVAGGLRYYAGLQVGLALAAAVSVAGLVSLLAAIPLASHAMALAATAYLIYLAWTIASSPVGEAADEKRPVRSSPAAGFALGVMNPKAYVAFASLVASYTLVADDARADGLLKWLLVVLVMLVVDLGWLLAGIALGWAKLAPRTERLLNLLLAAMILAAAVLALI
jgi:threonine/homoserine/homoserine lactone efflux protein